VTKDRREGFSLLFWGDFKSGSLYINSTLNGYALSVPTPADESMPWFSEVFDISPQGATGPTGPVAPRLIADFMDFINIGGPNN
jgi:hypothetical protein